MSYSLNRAMVLGNLTRDPEGRTTPSGQNVTSFSVATSRRWKDQQTGEMREAAEFHSIVAWGRLAQTVTSYCHKGSKVYVEGRIQTRSWEDPSGQKKYRTEIIADNVILLDPKGSKASNEEPAEAEAPKTEAAPTEQEINIDDIPF